MSIQDRQELIDRLAGLSLFSELPDAELENVLHSLEEAWFADGERVLREGLTGMGLFVIVRGSAAIIIDGEERARLNEGEVFGEVSALLGEPPTADVVAVGALQCLVLAAPQVEAFLLEHPRMMLRILQAEARRLRNANRARA
jgi:CRP-like cAMP-binding protein